MGHENEKFIESCGWCKVPLDDDQPVFGIGVIARKNFDFSKCDVGILEIKLVNQEKTVPAIVTGKDSQAKKDGKDLILMVCSENCGQLLKKALNDEIGVAELFN